MWYETKIIVKQNKHFYYQEGVSDNEENKQDLTEYEFVGLVGSWFKSIEKKEPLELDKRIIFGKKFKVYTVYKRGFFPFRKFEINWIPEEGKNSMEKIACFYKKHMVKQLPQKETDC